MFLSDKWNDYEIIDTGDGLKLERWGNIILQRPDPQVIWSKANPDIWTNCHAVYNRSETGGGSWNVLNKLPEKWIIKYDNLNFYVKPTGFKHTGLFPEQASNWDFMIDAINKANIDKPKVLNLFAYTGGASLALSMNGASVTHVDASKGIVQWAKDNMQLNKAPESNIRYIIEDAKRFAMREIRRGNTYHGILMDPPSYGRGPGGEVWKLENELAPLVALCAELLDENACFFVLNGYTTGFSQSVLYNILLREVKSKHGGNIVADELCLPVSNGGFLPCGTTARWTP